MEGFVAEEGNDLLPPKSMDRTNLIDCYQALLLAAFMEEGLFHVSVGNQGFIGVHRGSYRNLQR